MDILQTWAIGDFIFKSLQIRLLLAARRKFFDIFFQRYLFFTKIIRTFVGNKNGKLSALVAKPINRIAKTLVTGLLLQQSFGSIPKFATKVTKQKSLVKKILNFF